MTVYKGYLKIIKYNKAMIFLYVLIFFSVTLIFQSAWKETTYSNYQAESIKIGLVDKEKSVFSESLKNYLEQFHQVTLMKDDKAVLQENLFYRNVEYIIRIPADFYRRCGEKGEKLTVTKVPGSYSAFYVDQQMNSFLNNARTYYAAGFTEKEAAKALMNMESGQVTLYQTDKNSGEIPSYAFYFQYLPYLFLTVLCYVLGNVISAFQKGDIPKRMQASAITARRQSAEGLLAAATAALGLWVLAFAVAVICYGTQLLSSERLIYYILNSLALLLVSLSLSYLVGSLAKGINALNGAVNVISLGMCFLCGVFVSLDYLSQNVKKAAHFLPVYWYETVNNRLSECSVIEGAVKTEIFQAIGIQLVFAAALVSITMAVVKRKQTR